MKQTVIISLNLEIAFSSLITYLTVGIYTYRHEKNGGCFEIKCVYIIVNTMYWSSPRFFIETAVDNTLLLV